MLIVIVVVALAYNGLFYLGMSVLSQSGSYRYRPPIEDYIADAEAMGDTRTAEKYRYFAENGIDIWYGRDQTDSWRNDATEVLFQVKWFVADNPLDKIPLFGAAIASELSSAVNSLDQAIRDYDWKTYYSLIVKYSGYLDMLPGDFDGLDGFTVNEYILWGFQYKVDNDVASDDWRNVYVDSLSAMKASVAYYNGSGMSGYEDTLETLNGQIALAEYILEHNVRSYTGDSLLSMASQIMGQNHYWPAITGSTSMLGILSVLMIIVAGGILSSEFTAGTVKFLLINPVKRWKVFASKYISILTFTLIMLFAFYLSNLLFAGLFFGFGNIFAPHLTIVGGKVAAGSSLLYAASTYLLGSIDMVCMATLAFAISSLTRSSALSIGLSVFLYFSGSIAVTVLNMVFNLYQAKYILFANTDLNAVINGSTGFVGHTLTFAILNIAVYMVIFLLAAWDGFVRGDIR